MKLMQGKVQKAIVASLGVRPLTARELIAKIYDVNPNEATLSQESVIRRAIGRLAKGGVVKESVIYTRDGSRCWTLDQVQIREEPKTKLRSI